jgi:hypothetical protein
MTGNAIAATTFDQSLGVNIHLWETGGAYNNIPLVESSLAYLGATNVRDQLVPWSWVQPEYTEMMAAGYHFDFIEEPAGAGWTLQNIPTYISMINAFVAATLN